MTNRIILLPALLVIFTAVAQKDIPLKDVRYYGGVKVDKPVMCDSINVNGEKFLTKNLLGTLLNEPGEEKYKMMKANNDSLFIVGKPKTGNQLSLWKFFVTPENFMPVKLEIKSTSPFEVYLDGEKNKDKTTKESSREKAGLVTIDLKADPRQYVILVKTLSSAGDSCDTYLSATLKTEKRDSLSQVEFSSNDRRLVYTQDFLAGKRILKTTISPNGKWALTDYNFVDDKGDKSKITELSDLQSGKLLWKDESNRRLSWMPASNLLYYTSEKNDKIELRTLDPVFLQENIVAKNLPESDFAWSPKENFLIFSINETFPEDKGELHRLLSPEDRQDYFRKRSSLYMYELSTGICSRLTYGKEDTWLCDISPDEKKLLFGTRKPFIARLPFSETSMFMLDLETMKVDTIWYKDGYASYAGFSPDGKQLLLIGGPDAFGGIGLNIDEGQIANQFDVQIFIMDLKTRKINPISKEFDSSITSAIWSKADGRIYLTAEDKDYEHLFVYDPAKNKFSMIPATPDIVSGLYAANNAQKLVYYGSTISYTGRVYSMDLKSMKETVVSDPGAERLNKVDFGKTEDWDFVAADGTTIDGRFYLPPHFDPSKKYPVLVYYYGGTSPTSRAFESNYPLNQYAAMGYIVYTLQPSGTTGFGQKFSARHVNAWGEYAADEIIQGTKLFCRTHEFADSTRIGCFGASYGGFMTMYLLTKTDIFKAAVSHAGISSIASYWGEGYWGYSYSGAASTGSYPWNNPKMYTEQSPLYNADKINTPLLLLQGKMDTNVPIGESIQMYNALKILGKDVELVHVDGENHSIRNFKRKLEWQRTILAFFAKNLKGDERWWNELYKPTAIEE